MATMRLALVVSVNLLAVVYGVHLPTGFDEEVCSPYPDSGARAFPKVIQDYMAIIEWNNHISKQSYLVEEYVSHPLNKGTMFVTGFAAPGIKSQFITSPNTDEFFTIYDAEKLEFEEGNCIVQPLAKQEEFALPFAKDSKGRMHLMGGQALFDLGSSPVGALYYNGTDVVNGINCDVWTGCVFIKEGYITITLTYYFSQNDTDSRWVMPGGTAAAPVMLKAVGQGQDNYKIDQTFNYIYFSDTFPSVDPRAEEYVFETPQHAFCAGRKTAATLPRVPIHFSFRAEIIDNIAKTVQFTSEWYDFNSKYTRMDFKQAPTKDPQKDTLMAPKTLVNDFYTGISYIMDKFSGDCVVIPILSGEFDSMGVGNVSVRIRSPEEFFDFDNTAKYPYQHSGRHLIRGVEANSWISFRPFPNSEGKVKATYEWYFANNETVMKVGNLVENLEPIQTTIKSAQANVDMTYNIYRFSENAPDNRVFDVRVCYEDSGSVSFDMQLTGNWSAVNAPKYPQVIEYWFAYSLERYAGVRPIRVVDIEFEYIGENILIRFTLLGPALIQGDSGNKIEQLSLQDAADRITEAFTTNELIIYLMTEAYLGAAVLTPVPNTLRVIERKDHPSAYRPRGSPPLPAKQIPGEGLDGGAGAGFGIGMMVLGMLIAGVGVCVLSTRKSKPVAYTRDLNRNQTSEQE